jgi:hypothetical protein
MQTSRAALTHPAGSHRCKHKENNDGINNRQEPKRSLYGGKSVKIRIISKKGNTREQTRRELMEMSANEIDKLFEPYEFRDPMDNTLTRDVVFQELLKLAVKGSACLIEEAKSEGKSETEHPWSRP